VGESKLNQRSAKDPSSAYICRWIIRALARLPHRGAVFGAAPSAVADSYCDRGHFMPVLDLNFGNRCANLLKVCAKARKNIAGTNQNLVVPGWHVRCRFHLCDDENAQRG